MSDPNDLLARATRALRESGDAAPTRGAGASRLAFELARRKRTSGRKRTMAVVLLAASFPLAAWAANSSAVRRMVTTVVEHVNPFGSAPTASVERSHEPTLVAPVPSSAPESAPAPKAPLEPVPEVPRTAPSAASKAPSPAVDVDRLYRSAHAAHFEGHDPSAALAAWNAYLDAAPQGEFALEARYNRALTLVRLGRLPEAKAALAPFARGDYGGYRRVEAQDLVRRIEAKDASP